MDLQIIQGHLPFDFSIGASFYIGTPKFKKNYRDREWWRCFQIALSLCGANCFLTIPLWIDSRDDVPAKTAKDEE